MAALNTVREAADLFRAAGVTVMPVKTDGSKKPDVSSWKKYQTTPPDPTTHERWFRDAAGLGAVCGPVSGGLFGFDWEIGAAVDEYMALAKELGHGHLVARVAAGYYEEAPSGGAHILVRCPERPDQDGEHLASDADGNLLLEGRGVGSYFVILAPTNGTCHPSGRPYVLRLGGVETIENVTPDELDVLISIGRMLDRTPPPPPREPPKATTSNGDIRPGDDFNARAPWAEAFGDGWKLVASKPGRDFWQRPGAHTPQSGNVAAIDGVEIFYMQSSGCPDLERGGYDKFGVYTHLHHRGDWSAAARALAQAGYGTRPSQSGERWDPFDDDQPDEPADDKSEPDGPGSTWRPVDLGPILDGTYQPETTTLLRRTDGFCLLYTGRVNEFHGEPESAKSLLAQHAAAEALQDGLTVAYIDYEDTSAGVTGRLCALGVPADTIRRSFIYISPDEKFDANAARHLRDGLDGRPFPKLVVIDGVTASFATFGYSITDNDDAAAWFAALARPLANEGAAVLLIDHVTKSREDRGHWAIGGQHKRAAQDGAAYEVKIITGPMPGSVGTLRLISTKDRHGALRGAGIPKGGTAATVTIDGTDRPNIRVAVTDPTSGSRWRPTILMERVSDYLQLAAAPVTRKEIRDNVTGNNQHKDQAADELDAAGYATKATGTNNAITFTFVKAFRDPDNRSSTVL